MRFGVKSAGDADIRSTIPVVDRELGVTTPNGRFWHRYNHDGYGETPDGGPFPGPGNTGRLWPIFAGERGEYELAHRSAGARDAARARLRAIAATGNDGFMLPEPGSTAGGNEVTFWMGFILAREPACAPLYAWIDDEPVPRRLTLRMGVRRCE